MNTTINVKVSYDKSTDRMIYQYSNAELQAIGVNTSRMELRTADVGEAAYILTSNGNTCLSLPMAAVQGMLKAANQAKYLQSIIGTASYLSLGLSVTLDVAALCGGYISFEKFMGSFVVNSITFCAQTLATYMLVGMLGIYAIAPIMIAGIAIGGIGMIINQECGEDVGNFMKEAGSSVLAPIIATALDYFDPIHPFGKAATTYRIDPIVLDLNGDGITFGTATDGYAQFDLDNNGFKERTAWLNAQDGFLARDINGNDLIDDGSELFGDRTALKNGKMAASGFEALKDLDDNNDGILDKLDKAFQTLKIWQDKDGDGITDEGEMNSLTEAGIASINLDSKSQNNTKVQNYE